MAALSTNLHSGELHLVWEKSTVVTGPTSEDEDMATKSTNPNDETTNEETEPEPFVHPEGDDDFNGVPGQLRYPDVHVDAERAAG